MSSTPKPFDQATYLHVGERQDDQMAADANILATFRGFN